MAVAIVIGATFGTVVAALVKDLLTPTIAAIIQKLDFSAIAFEINATSSRLVISPMLWSRSFWLRLQFIIS